MIQGVRVKKLKKIPDERGTIMHMLKKTDPEFSKFGEIYFTTAYPGVIKGWHLHTKMTLNYVVLVGMIKLVLYDDRKNSVTYGNLMELFIGDDDYSLITVPPNIWNGFKVIGTKTALLANCPDLQHDPKEMKRLDPLNNDLISYDWEIKLK